MIKKWSLKLAIDLPAMLDCPAKMLPLLTEFNNYRYFLCRGGRGGGKSYNIASDILYIGSIRKVRVLCGREVQNSIKDSVHTLLSDIIKRHGLDYTIKTSEIIHNKTGSSIIFVGLREQGINNIKSYEGIDICWVEEAQSLSKKSIDYLVPTIRKKNSKIILSGNPDTVDDAWLQFFMGRDDTLVININYFDNKFCGNELRIEADKCKERSQSDYDHIWLGMPQSTYGDYLYNYDDLNELKSTRVIQGEENARIIGIDVAGAGCDSSVAVIMRQTSGLFWVVEAIEKWKEEDTTKTLGRILTLNAMYNPVIMVQDICGLGKPIYDMAVKGVKDCKYIGFNGAENPHRLDYAFNRRAEAYLCFRDFLRDKNMFINSRFSELFEELKATRMKYAIRSVNGTRSDTVQLLDKMEIKKALGRSPDTADAFSMAIWGIKTQEFVRKSNSTIKLINKTRRK